MSRSFPPLVPFVLALLLLVPSSCVTMGKYRALKTQVDGIEAQQVKHAQEIETIKVRLDNLKSLTDKEDDSIRQRLANLAADLTEQRQMLGQVQGRQEEVDFKFNEVAKNVKGLKGLVEDRFGVDSQSLPKELPEQPEEFFELGMSAFKSGLTHKAQAIFQEFLKRFPEHEKADDAQYMTGEALLAEGRFTEAVAAYKKVYDQYQTGDRYREAVLRIGLTYVRSNKCKKALKIYEFAASTFKNTDEGKIAAEEVKNLKKVCK